MAKTAKVSRIGVAAFKTCSFDLREMEEIEKTSRLALATRSLTAGRPNVPRSEQVLIIPRTERKKTPMYR